jgi:hypothetical protein
MILTIRSTPRPVEPPQHREFNANKDLVEHLDVFCYPDHVENITDWKSHPPPTPLPRTEIYPGVRAPLSDYIVYLWERNAQRCLEENLQNNRYNPFAMHAEYKYIERRAKIKGLKMYYDNVL